MEKENAPQRRRLGTGLATKVLIGVLAAMMLVGVVVLMLLQWGVL